jgi:hypothetical protein
MHVFLMPQFTEHVVLGCQLLHSALWPAQIEHDPWGPPDAPVAKRERLVPFLLPCQREKPPLLLP